MDAFASRNLPVKLSADRYIPSSEVRIKSLGRIWKSARMAAAGKGITASARMTVSVESRPRRSSALKVAPEPGRPKVSVLSKVEIKPPTLMEPLSHGRYLLSPDVAASASAARLEPAQAAMIKVEEAKIL